MLGERILVGIDDTDNLTSRGTGHRARGLARALELAGIGHVAGVTRHQLLVHEDIPYTSHNSSACISLAMDAGADLSTVMSCCRSFLLDAAAEGSDVGLCAAPEAVAADVQEFGRAAQTRVLKRGDAEALAEREGIPLEGLTGDHGGKIGALAAIGLHATGEDGRYLWVRGVRELEEETVALGDLVRMTGVDVFRTLDGMEITDPAQMIYLGPWPRPIRDAGKATLLLEQSHGTDAHWKVLDKDVIKSYRP